MGLGDSWTDTTPGSVSKLNKVTVISGTGTYLTGLDKDDHTILVATDTSGGLTANHVYLCSADGLSLIDITDVNEHTHRDANNGGSIVKILIQNDMFVDTGITGFTNVGMSGLGNGYFFRELNTGTGVITANTIDGTTNERYLEMDTGATSASTSSIRIPINLGVKFSEDSTFQAKHKIITATSLAIKCGIGAEDLSGADNAARKYGAECCTSVNANWFAFSADGTTRSSSDTGTAFTTNKRGIMCDSFPDIPKIDLYIENQTAFTKTSNIPITNSANQPDRDAIFRYSVKNNTAASRKFNFYGARLVYRVSDDSGII